MSDKAPGSSAREMANAIADALFLRGQSNEAVRLKIIQVGERDGGGWCRDAVRDVIEEKLLKMADKSADKKTAPEKLSDTSDFAYRNVIALAQKLVHEGVSMIAVMGALEVARLTVFDSLRGAPERSRSRRDRK